MRQPPGWRRIGLVIAAVLALACVLVVPPVVHPPLSSADLEGVASAEKRIELQQAQAKLRDDVRATLLQGIAGLLLLLGAFATWRQVQISREGQITERFSRAIEQLGSGKEDVQLGGIYTLERVARDSSGDRRTVQSVLGAYVRTHAPWPVGSPEGPQHPTPTVDRQLAWLLNRAPDVQAALGVLGRRPRSPDEPQLQLNLSRVDLRGAFLHGARLSEAQFRHSNLARALLPGAQLQNADLEDVDLREAKLQRARLTGANLHRAYLQGADLQGADLRGANLQGADLAGADLAGANLTDVDSDATTVWPEGFQPG
jgi:Pentapeptide repeats (8 copies)